jgi:hypothetical protein
MSKNFYQHVSQTNPKYQAMNLGIYSDANTVVTRLSFR